MQRSNRSSHRRHHQQQQPNHQHSPYPFQPIHTTTPHHFFKRQPIAKKSNSISVSYLKSKIVWSNAKTKAILLNTSRHWYRCCVNGSLHWNGSCSENPHKPITPHKHRLNTFVLLLDR